MANANLHAAKTAKNDEFYTTKQAIETEIGANLSYRKSFEGKTVLMNCDDPETSEFWKFFVRYFHVFKLKKIISTHFNMDGSPSYKLEWDGTMVGGNAVNMIKTPLKGNGDFASPECVALLDESDIVVTNPPFSLFRDFIKLIMEHNKKFVVISNMNAITYKEFFPLIKENKVWVGYGFNLSMIFKTPYPNTLEANRKYVISKGYNPDDGYIKTPAIAWFTNIDIAKRHEEMELFNRYYPEDYPKYDNYDAINVDKVSEIPCDYMGTMGVPITFLDKYCPEQFEIIGMDLNDSVAELGIKEIGKEWVELYRKQGGKGHITANMHSLVYTHNGKAVSLYRRILIKRRKDKKTDDN